MGLQFFPRGGSSHVARSVARCLPEAGCDVRLLCATIPDGPGDADAFYEGLDVHAIPFEPGMPSYERRAGAPDPIMTSLDDAAYEREVERWERALVEAEAAEADVLHLHHLTPLNEAAARVAPDVPVVGHLHGTELLMLEHEPEGPWHERLGAWARACERIIVLSQSQIARAERLLGIDPERCELIPNGFDPETFTRRAVDREAFWARHDVPGFEPVALYVGRFTAVKRVPLLIEAHAAARHGSELVLVGGYPGEIEGEDPRQTVARTGNTRVHFAGWHPHDALPEFLSASDLLVLPSVREQFGQVLVEAMACGVPPVAVDAYGPAEIVDDGETGWLVPPDDGPALTRALDEAIRDPEERHRRGERARATARARYAWPALAARVAAVYEAVSRPVGRTG